MADSMTVVASKGSPWSQEADAFVDGPLTKKDLTKVAFGVQIMPLQLEGGKPTGQSAIFRTDDQNMLGFNRSGNYPRPSELVDAIASFAEKHGLPIVNGTNLFSGKRNFFLLQLDSASKENQGLLLVAYALDNSLTTFVQPLNFDARNEFVIAVGPKQDIARMDQITSIDPFITNLKEYRESVHGLKNIPVLDGEMEVLVAYALQPELVDTFIARHAVSTAKLRYHSTNPTTDAILSQEALRDAFRHLVFIKSNKAVRTVLEALSGSDNITLYTVLSTICRWVDHDRARSAENRINAALFGPAAKLKQDFRQLIIEHASEYHKPVEVPKKKRAMGR